jgi:hypothetical protein
MIHRMGWRHLKWSGVVLASLLLGGLGWSLQQPSRFLIPADAYEPDPDWEVPTTEPDPSEYEYVWARLAYESPGYQFYRNHNSWTVDYPKADRQFLQGVLRYTRIQARKQELVLRPLDSRLFDYPFLYAVEVGHLKFNDPEAARMREYLLRGGFLVVDDFHGSQEWANFEQEMKKVFPDRPIVDVPLSDPIFHCMFDIQELFQVPGLQYLQTGRPYEKDGYEVRYGGIYDDSDRIMVMINFNQDLGDAWEWADLPQYPERYTSQAYRLGVNYIVYALTH